MTAAELRNRRMALGLTQDGLAAVLSVEPSTVFRWEAGHRRVPAWLSIVLDTLERDGGSYVTQLAWLMRMRSIDSLGPGGQ
jgi:Predicted transcriptional regulators